MDKDEAMERLRLAMSKVPAERMGAIGMAAAADDAEGALVVILELIGEVDPELASVMGSTMGKIGALSMVRGWIRKLKSGDASMSPQAAESVLMKLAYDETIGGNLCLRRDIDLGDAISEAMSAVVSAASTDVSGRHAPVAMITNILTQVIRHVREQGITWERLEGMRRASLARLS